MKAWFFFTCVCLLPLVAQARLGERLKDFDKRYGEPVAQEAGLSVYLHHGVFIYGYFNNDKVCHRIIYAVKNKDFVPVIAGSRKYKPMPKAFRERFLEVNQEQSGWSPQDQLEPRLTWERDDKRAIAAYHTEDYYLDISRKLPDIEVEEEQDMLSEF